MDTAHPSAADLGRGAARADVDLLLAAQDEGLRGLAARADAIAAAVERLARVVLAGGRVRYVGAGTSGWLAALDAAETVVTFGATSVGSIVAGGLTLDPVTMTHSEDDEDAAVAAVRADGLGPDDLVIAVTASGNTPFTVAAVREARARGAQAIAVVNRPGSPIEALVDLTICVVTPPEIVAGSTRLAAGLVQKSLLNMLSTAAMVRAGRTYRGQMVGVDAANDKLRARLVDGVATATGVSPADAREAIEACDGRGDIAVVAIVAGIDPAEASRRLADAGGSIAAALGDH